MAAASGRRTIADEQLADYLSSSRPARRGADTFEVLGVAATQIDEYVPPIGRSASAFWLIAFVIFQMVCQVLLLFEVPNAVRLFLRTAAFTSSLALILIVPGRSLRHPALPLAWLMVAWLCLQMLHPYLNTPLAGMAQIGLYVAILGPLVWANRLYVTLRTLRRLLLVFWAFHSLSALVGVLQVYMPERFTFNISNSLITSAGDSIDGLKITLASGERVWRPTGLTDIPGGASNAGFNALMFGMVFLLSDRGFFLRMLSFISIGLGFFCIYVCQVRVTLVISLVVLATFSIVLLIRSELKRFFTLMSIVPAIVVGAFLWAASVGGESVTSRLATLIEDRPDRVYYENRGRFLESGIYDYAPEYPLGAGLGRWGMMNQYFGDNRDPLRSAIWSEIQLTSWILDGGIPLVLMYYTALLITCWTALRIALRSQKGSIELWASLILAYDVGALVTTFGFPLFLSSSGMEFWLLNALLFGADYRMQQAQLAQQQLHKSAAQAVPIPTPRVPRPTATAS
jgi:hypothetical protein